MGEGEMGEGGVGEGGWKRMKREGGNMGTGCMKGERKRERKGEGEVREK